MDTDAEWFAGSYVVNDPFYACDPATIIIPVDTLAGMSDENIVKHVRKAAVYAEMTHALHAAAHIEYRIQHDSRAALSTLVRRMDAEKRYFPRLRAAITRIQMYLERRASLTTRPGYIYLVEGRDCYKIGKTKDLPTRIRTIGIQLPFQTRLIHFIPTSDMVWAETYLHRTFADARLNGEWFNLNSDDVAWICAIQSINPD